MDRSVHDMLESTFNDHSLFIFPGADLEVSTDDLGAGSASKIKSKPKKKRLS